jgi:catechol 2,3-dioxygenase-like lactoylglutathione lyase family enzyme
MIQSIVHIALVVKDYDEAIEFNTRKLNFTLVEDIYQPEQDKRWVVIFGEIIMKWFSGE